MFSNPVFFCWYYYEKEKWPGTRLIWKKKLAGLLKLIFIVTNNQKLIKKNNKRGCPVIRDLRVTYRTSPVAASDSFRFQASNFIKKETPSKTFICESCKIFQNIFRQEHHWMTASCVYLWILTSFSDHLFHRAPLGNYLFHLQVVKNDKQCVKNCRPVSLFPICSKVYNVLFITRCSHNL